MAKRGRKPKERKGYFYETEEEAIVKYINCEDEAEKNRVFNTILYPALTKMIESIIRRYKLFVPDEEFEQNFNDTISYLLTKISHYKQRMIVYEEIEKGDHDFIEMDMDEFFDKAKDASEEDPEYVKVYERYAHPQGYGEEISYIKYYKKTEKHYKAYSYCGTICRNYLMYKCSQYSKKRQRNTPYDEVFEEISNSTRYTTAEDSYAELAEKLVKEIADEIEGMIKDAEKLELSEGEITVGKALISLLRNWEEVLPSNGSNKLQKSSVLYFLREETMMTTKEVRDNMKRYKCAYNLLKKAAIE